MGLSEGFQKLRGLIVGFGKPPGVLVSYPFIIYVKNTILVMRIL